jgi:hypothetical protein
MKPTIRHFAALTAFLATVSAAAHGQYLWLDERGKKQYSDMPPPASVPANRILRQPGARPPAPEASEQPKVQPDAAQPGMSVAEKDAEFRKRRAEQAEKNQKAAEQARLAAEMQQRCERNRDYRKTLESGIPIVRTDKDGQRVALTDAERAREMSEANRSLKDCK